MEENFCSLVQSCLYIWVWHFATGMGAISSILETESRQCTKYTVTNTMVLCSLGHDSAHTSPWVWVAGSLSLYMVIGLIIVVSLSCWNFTLPPFRMFVHWVLFPVAHMSSGLSIVSTFWGTVHVLCLPFGFPMVSPLFISLGMDGGEPSSWLRLPFTCLSLGVRTIEVLRFTNSTNSVPLKLLRGGRSVQHNQIPESMSEVIRVLHLTPFQDLNQSLLHRVVHLLPPPLLCLQCSTPYIYYPVHNQGVVDASLI